MIGKMLHIGKNLSKARRGQTILVCPKHSWGVWGGHDPREILQFPPLTWKQYFQHLNWHKTVIYLHVQKAIKIIKNLITRLEVWLRNIT